jgi:small redox-active disulfide protein 2
MPVIEICGSGCSRCKILAERADEAAKSLGLDYTLTKVTEMPQIMARGVMSTPAMVVDGVVKVQGQIPSVEALATLLGGKN